MKRLIRVVKKLVYWIPIIIKDEDYDYSYFWIIVYHKFITIESYFKSKKELDKVKGIRQLIKYVNRLKGDFCIEASPTFKDEVEWYNLHIDKICKILKEESMKWWD